MRTLAVALMLALALAGCSESDPSEASKLDPKPAPTPGGMGNEGEAPEETEPETTGGSGSDPEPDPTNTPPQAVLEASPVTGVAPLAVTFTINGTDADGDALTWALDLDGDGAADAEGTELPATVEHSFDEGEHVANLTLSDGEATTMASAAIEVGAPEVPAPEGPVQVVDGTYALPFEGCTIAFPSHLAEQDLGFLVGGELDGISRVQFDVDAATIGHPFIVTWTFDVGYLYAGLAFTDADGAILDDVTTDPSGMETGFDELTKEGTVPDGAVKGVAWTCGGPAEATVHYEA